MAVLNNFVDIGSFTTSGGFEFYQNSPTVMGVYGDNGGVNIATSGITLSDATWRHIAVVRNGTTAKIYIDGTERASGIWANNLTANNLFLGAYYNGTTTNTMNGYMDELRITRGVARYTTNFTPPSSEFPNG